MDYSKIYFNLTHNKNNDNLTYYENHHIIPKCMGGTDDSDNIVKLSLREHYLAHKLLCKIYPDSKPLAHALWMMTICTIGAMEHYLENDLYRSDGYLIRRTRAFQNQDEKNIIITSKDYEYAKEHFYKLARGIKRTDEQCLKISNATKNGMRNKECIEKCRANKGTHFYYDIHTGKVNKWFPGDPELDLTKYAWGRGPMSQLQKLKLSELKLLKKEYYYISELDLKYVKYIDFINDVPQQWEKRWVNYSNMKMKKYIVDSVRDFNLQTNYEFDNLIVIKAPNKSKNFNIISPSLYECCYDTLLKFKKGEITSTDEMVLSIKNNIYNILELNKKYLNLEKLNLTIN